MKINVEEIRFLNTRNTVRWTVMVTSIVKMTLIQEFEERIYGVGAYVANVSISTPRHPYIHIP